jgi:two-component system OmpR family sensor kinase
MRLRLRDGAMARRFNRLSLRSRLIALLLLLLLVSSAVVAVATSLALRGFLLDRLDQQLAAAGVRYSASLEHPADDDADDGGFGSVVGQPVGTLGARILNGTVTAVGVVGAGNDQREPSAADRAAIAALTVTGGPRTVDLPDLGDYRIIVAAGRDGDLLVTGLPEHEVDETIGRLLWTELAVFGVALLLTGLAGAVFIRLSMRPLTQVAGTALAVSDLPLASGEVSLPARVPNPAPGTEVGQVADAFNHMLEHVESALSERHASEDRLRHFVADASHELRTPVAVIRSHADFAQRAADDLPEDVQQALARISAESDRMGHLVEDLLLLARLDAGRPLALQDVDLTRLAIDAVSDARAAGPDHRWQLELPDEPVIVRGDEHRLHQALANLLANARAHTPQGTVITTEVAEDRAPGTVTLSVVDTGPGISPEMLPHVFERFVRAAGARSHASGSTGLGLSIVDAIVRAHGATISVNSEPGRTEFVIRLAERAAS